MEVSLFTKKRGILTKQVSLDQNGELVKDGTPCALSNGKVKTIQCVSLDALASCLNGLKTNQAVSYGVCGRAKAEVVSRKCQPTHPDAITRTKENFDWLDQAVMMIDYDPPEGTESVSPDQLRQMLIEVMPELEGIAMLWRPSASSNIYSGKTELAGITGQRIYIVVNDGKQIPRIGEIMAKRLWLTGHGYIAISKSGAMLVRCPVDTNVWQPERLDFAAGASCVAPLEHRPVKHRLFEGDFLATYSVL